MLPLDRRYSSWTIGGQLSPTSFRDIGPWTSCTSGSGFGPLIALSSWNVNSYTVYVSNLVDPYRSAAYNNGSGVASAASLAIVEWIVKRKKKNEQALIVKVHVQI